MMLLVADIRCQKPLIHVLLVEVMIFLFSTVHDFYQPLVKAIDNFWTLLYVFFDSYHLTGHSKRILALMWRVYIIIMDKCSHSAGCIIKETFALCVWGTRFKM